MWGWGVRSEGVGCERWEGEGWSVRNGQCEEWGVGCEGVGCERWEGEGWEGERWEGEGCGGWGVRGGV